MNDNDLICELRTSLDTATDDVHVTPGTVGRARVIGTRRRRARRAMQATPPLLAVGAAAIILASGGGSPALHPVQPSQTANGHPSPTGIQRAAFISKHIKAAMANAADQDVFEFYDGTVDVRGWMSVDSQTGDQQQRSVGYDSSGQPQFENGITATDVNGTLHFHTITVSYPNRTWSEDDSVAAVPMSTSTTSTPATPAGINGTSAQITAALNAGQITKISQASTDGQEALKLHLTSKDQNSVVLWVNAGSYQPIRLTTSAPSGHVISAMTLLPKTAANIALSQPQIPAGYTQTTP